MLLRYKIEYLGIESKWLAEDIEEPKSPTAGYMWKSAEVDASLYVNKKLVEEWLLNRYPDRPYGFIIHPVKVVEPSDYAIKPKKRKVCMK